MTAAPPTNSNPTTTLARSETTGQVVVEQTKLIYESEQQGGHFHAALVLVRNDSARTAIDVGGQVSILDHAGRLVKSIDPSPVTLLPHAEGLLVDETIDLPRPVLNGKLAVHLVTSRLARSAESPVSFTGLSYRYSNRVGIAQCTFTGTVSNRFTEEKQNLQLEVAAFIGAKLVTGGFTYVDTVFPRTDATFEVDLTGPAMCPRRVDRIVVLPNLSEDKIFNP